MTKLIWGDLADRRFEAGVDRGVLYIGDEPGVAWNGLVAVKTTQDGGAFQSMYYDGRKYRNETSPEELKGSIEAFFSPPEFDQCEGVQTMTAGLKVTNQRRVPFNLAYRTKVGDGLTGAEAGYKIHLLYNLKVDPSDRTSATLNDKIDAANLNWDFVTSPLDIDKKKPSSHLIIDSTQAFSKPLESIESILYGDELDAPRLPMPSEILDIFISQSTLTVTDNGDGTWTARGPSGVVLMTSSTEFQINYPTAVWIDENTYQLSTG